MADISKSVASTTSSSSITTKLTILNKRENKYLFFSQNIQQSFIYVFKSSNESHFCTLFFLDERFDATTEGKDYIFKISLRILSIFVGQIKNTLQGKKHTIAEIIDKHFLDTVKAKKKMFKNKKRIWDNKNLCL